jgi:hypothetical protein
VVDVAHRSVSLRDVLLGGRLSNLQRLTHLNEPNVLGNVQVQ